MTISGPAPTSSSATITTMPANKRAKPNRTTRRGEASGKTFGIPAAARSSVIDSGSSRTPVRSPTARARPTGTAGRRRTGPPATGTGRRTTSARRATGRLSSMRRIEQRLAARSSRRFSQLDEEPQHAATAEHQPDHGREPEPLGRAGLGLDEPPRRPTRRMPNTIRGRDRAPTARCRRGRAHALLRAACRPSAGERPG